MAIVMSHPETVSYSADAQSKTIDWLRFAMAVLVVLLHAGDIGPQSDLPIYRTLCRLTTAGICQLAVPCFFLISGYLFFRNLETWDFDVWKGKMLRRLRTLFLPFILWNLIAVVSILTYSYLRTKLGSLDPESFLDMKTKFSGLGFLRNFWDIN